MQIPCLFPGRLSLKKKLGCSYDPDNTLYTMTVGLFIPCYVNQFYPSAAKATLHLLKKLRVHVVFPPKQTCCGQPMANSGFEHLTTGCNELFIESFSGF